MQRTISFVLCVLLFVSESTDGYRSPPQCRDEHNQAVDWFVIYKLPKIAESSDPLLRKGLGYLYMTNDTADSGWRLSTKSIAAKDSIPGNTLALLYDDTASANKLWVLYNDNPPNKAANAKYGHTKGVVLADNHSGFWLIHSVPNFPPAPRGGEEPSRRSANTNSTLDATITSGTYDYPDTGKNYGQSFLCISLKNSQFDTVGRQLMYNQIIVYRRNAPEALQKRYSVLADAINGVRVRNEPYKNKEVLRSSGSVEFVSFAKNDKWQKDLYDDFVAPQLKSDLFTETWLNGRGRLPSDCAGAKVYNVESIVLSAANVNFRSSQDHSKWAVTTDSKRNQSWVCIGDINRADTQYIRGGGTVCFNLLNVWRNYRNSVNDIEPCPRIHA